VAIAASARFPQRACAWICVTTAVVLAGCVSQDTKRDAVNDINAAFKGQYEAVVTKDGTRAFSASPERVFDATNSALVSLGMVIKQQTRGLGYLQAEAPAPSPLSRSEWDRASAVDLPKAKDLLRPHVGALAELFKFEPEGLDIVVTATIIEVRGGAEVSLTMRMREVAPPQTGMPRREYPPPTALQLGLDKIWNAIDRQLKLLAPPKP
jgi:hypothetical protein